MTEGAKTGMGDTFKEVHVTLADGRTIYWPKGDMSRLAPAAVCSVVSRMQRLRAELKKDRYDMREIERLINEPIAFEKQFLSGDSLTVHNAIKEAGKDELTEALKVAGEIAECVKRCVVMDKGFAANYRADAADCLASEDQRIQKRADALIERADSLDKRVEGYLQSLAALERIRNKG